MPRVTATDKEQILADIIAMYEGGCTWSQIVANISTKYGRPFTLDGVRNRYRRQIEKATTPTGKDLPADAGFQERVAAVVQLNKKPLKQFDLDDMHSTLTTAQGIRQDVNPDQPEAKVSIAANQPIALTFISDVHLGSQYTNYDAFFADLKLISGDPRFFVCVGGDWQDKFMPSFKDAAAVTSQIVPADIQLLFTKKILEALSPSIVACIGGNHNEMDMRLTGISTERMIHRDSPAAFMPNGGLLTLTVGGAQYKILWKHHWRFNSALNQFNTHHRMLEGLDPTVDIVVTEHEHNPGIESVERFAFGERRTVISIRTGAYKEADPFSVKFYKSGRRGPQTLILWPDRREAPMAIHGDDALRRAQTFLDGWSQKQTSCIKKETKRVRK